MTAFRTRPVVVYLVVAFVSAVSVTATATPRMDRSKLLVGAYSFNKAVSDEAHVRAAKECGLDFIIGVPASDRKALDLFAKYDLGVIASGALDFWWGGNGSKAGKMRDSHPKNIYANQVASFVAKFDHPAIWMLDLCDEPSALDMSYIGEICDLAAARAPETPPYVNLYPNYAVGSSNTDSQTRNQLGTATYREHIETYCRTSPLDYISYDFYPYSTSHSFRSKIYPKMYENFNIVADACRRTGRSLWYVPQVNSHDDGPVVEPTTENRLRFQAYTAMAFGAEVITWACWVKGWWTNNVFTASGEKTAQYNRLRTINAELRRLGALYMRFRNTDTHYVGFSAAKGLETLGVPKPESLDTGCFSGVRTIEGTPLLIGEMVPRDWKDSSRALFLVASGDPYDVAPAMRTITFRIQNNMKAEAFGPMGAIELVRTDDGASMFPIAENGAVLLVCSRK